MMSHAPATANDVAGRVPGRVANQLFNMQNKQIKVPLTPVVAMFLAVGSAHLQGREADAVTDELLLELYHNARVADVVDALSIVGYHGIGVMDPKIAPLWRDVDTMGHQLSGIAVTVRYGPTNHPMHAGADLTKPENYPIFNRWQNMWFRERSPEPFQEFIKKGTVIVIDNQDDNDAGTTGSANIMYWKNAGAVGVVCVGGVRDTDEIIRQKVPVYTNYNERGRGRRIGRNELIDVQRPVVVGGVLVHPGDVVVGDSDGVVVVPRRVAARVGQLAYVELYNDMAKRKRIYQQRGIPLDDTIQVPETPEQFFGRQGLPIDPNKPAARDR
jgi:4-hydroxy-4-methyl-2-oxoglutarate aldolase